MIYGIILGICYLASFINVIIYVILSTAPKHIEYTEKGIETVGPGDKFLNSGSYATFSVFSSLALLVSILLFLLFS